MKMIFFKRTVKYIAIAALLVLFAGAGQLAQLLNSNDDVRKYALEVWAGEDEEQQEQVNLFTQACLKGYGQQAKGDFKKEMELRQKGILPEPAIKLCAEKYGYTELYVVVNKADSVLQSVSWPLSLLSN